VQNSRPDPFFLAEALIEVGAIRLRPIFLTAAAMFGAFVIILDPIFSGLA